jgi:hypothetical protein
VKEGTMNEERPIRSYIPGDAVKLELLIKHRRNIAYVEAALVHEDGGTEMGLEGKPRFKRWERPDRWERDGSKQSVVEFGSFRVDTAMRPGIYRLSRVYAYYPNRPDGSQSGAFLDVPSDLAVRIAEEPNDTPEVLGWDR